MNPFSTVLDLSDLNIPDISPDILIISAPLTVSEAPFMAGAVLKAVANKAGYSCSTVDFNRLTLQWLQTDALKNKYAELIKFFFSDVSYLQHGVLPDTPHANKIDYTTEIDQWLLSVSYIIEKYNPKILGISVFTDASRTATKLITSHVKKYFPKIKIIVGGHGIAKNKKYGISDAISFGEKLSRDGLVDHYIQGDAEHSFYEFLKDNLSFAGINQDSWDQIDNPSLESLPYPDYSDYNWNLYPRRIIGINGSRGCVRQCKFCDYIAFHKNYTWRSGDNIFEEMLEQKNKHNISYFQFSDSLINGNMKEYRRLVERLADYNNQNPDDKLYWDSYFILRPKNHFSEELWRLTAESGCKSLFIGIETFSDSVRDHMGKKFTNDDIDYGLSMATKYNVLLMFLMFVGYPSETNETFEENITWLNNNQHHKEHFILYVTCSMELAINSWLDLNREAMNVVLLDQDDRQQWVNTENGNTLEVREKRRRRLILHAKNLKYSVLDDFNVHAVLENILLS